MAMDHRKNNFNVVLFEWRFSETLYKYTLGLHYITSILRKENFNVWDLIFEDESAEDVHEEIISLEPDVIGISFYREMEEEILTFCRLIKSKHPEIKIILGGHTATLYASYILNKEPCADIIVIGEGELTFVDVCTRLQNGESLEGCKGIFYRKDNIVKRNEDRELIENLDELPYPALDVLIANHKTSKCVFTAISTSRGCLGKCGFCITNRIYGDAPKKEWRGRSPENVIEEIKYLQDAFSDKRLVYRIVDGSFEDPDPIEKSRIKRIIALFEENDINIPFSILTRSDSWTEKDEQLIKRMKNVGLYEVAVGFEACTTKSLKVFNKRAEIEDNYRTYDLFNRNNINVFGFLIMFHPYTSLEELKKNAKFLLDMNIGYQPQNWWSTLYLWPDSRMLPNVVRDGLLLGLEAEGYQMLYAFEDGRVEQVSQVLNEIGEFKSTHAYRESIEKIKLECLLYDAWKVQYEEMKAIDKEMEMYKNLYETNRKEMGIKQYELFIRLVEAVESNTFEDIKNDVIKEWKNLMVINYENLEREWIKYRMKFGRKKVILI